MKNSRPSFSAVVSLALLSFTTAQATDLRWMGFDMNTDAQSTFSAPVHKDTTQAGAGPLYNAPIGSLAGTLWGPGANGMNLSGTTNATSGTSFATTTWSINGVTDTLNMTMNHGISGAIAPNNFAGSEGVFYFYALTPGWLSVTYDYGFEETGATTEPYKASERGRSKQIVYKNSKGLGDGGDYGATEIVNRDGSRTFYEYVTPADDLIGLAFDFRILEDPQQTTIADGYSTMTFTPGPVPEPSTLALFGLAAVGVFAARRRAR